MSDTIELPLASDLTSSAAQYAAASRGAGTRRVYTSQWGQYTDWCQREGYDPFSGPTTIALHIAAAANAGLSSAIIKVRLAAIRYEYRQAEVPLDMDDAVLAPVREGIKRTLGTAPKRKAAPASAEGIRAMLDTLRRRTDAKAARDRAILLLGFMAALRRSEVVGLDIGDVVEVKGKGIEVRIRRSKTDQCGAGQVIPISANPRDPSFCAVVAVRRWMEHRGGSAGDPLFLSIRKDGKMGERLADKRVSLLVKDLAEAAGFDSSEFSGHSLRRGFLTEAAEAGADLKGIMRHSRHKDAVVAMSYIDAADAWKNNLTSTVFGGH